MPIADLAVELVADETTQKVEWEPEMYLKVHENLKGTVTTSQGLPVTLIKDFVIQNNTVELVDDAAAREHSFVFTWPDAGSYDINITMYNLHSNEEFGSVKYAHNFTTTIHVQNPFYDFTHYLEDSWLTLDKVDFQFTSTNELQPSRPLYYNCSWNDSTIETDVDFNENEDYELEEVSPLLELKVYHFYHIYSTAGIYNPVCTLYNMVDSEEFTQEITVYETIVDFMVEIHYNEKETGILRRGLGQAKNKVPLGVNPIFKFGYTSGTIEKIKVVNTTDGASVGSVKGVVGRFPKSGSKLVGADEGIEVGIDDCGEIAGMAVG